MSHRQNIARIKAVYQALEEISVDVVFVGGATVSLYSTRPDTETRPTDDVDILIELINYRGYSEIEEKLRSKGFVNDVESGVICRYIIQGITVDVMPTDKSILGFSNKWYPEGFSHAVSIAVDEYLSVRIFTAPYFLAAKLEAFRDRGGNDGRFSTDFEDIIHVLNNRGVIWEEIRKSDESLKQYLKDEIRKLLEQRYLDEWVSAHLDFQEQRRVVEIIGAMTEYVKG